MMEKLKKRNVFCFLLLVIISIGCENLLTKSDPSALTSKTVLNSESGINSALNSAYSGAQQFFSRGFTWGYFISTMPSGEAYNRGGTVANYFGPLSNFTWNTGNTIFEYAYNWPYYTIRDANTVINNIEGKNFDNEFVKQKTAEAKFLRAYSYILLNKYFGPTPLVTSSDQLSKARATEDEMNTFIIEELQSAADILPATQEERGRATKGSALGLLCKFYLNNKEWKEAADVAKQIMDLNVYSLVPEYKDVFALDNKDNSEMIWVLARNKNATTRINNFTFPTDYPFPPNASTYAARVYYNDEFINSFENGDERKELFITEYTNTSGDHVQLLGNDQTISGKYPFDTEAVAQGDGDDFPVLRYSDILLSRAEALNEMNGPNKQSIDLINKVRKRAGISNLDLGDFGNKEALHKHIEKERQWEFYSETKSREDQIRYGNFISGAQARGKNAKSYQVLFPIPAVALEANKNLTQNSAY